jgi:hypothetical protein
MVFRTVTLLTCIMEVAVSTGKPITLTGDCSTSIQSFHMNSGRISWNIPGPLFPQFFQVSRAQFTCSTWHEIEYNVFNDVPCIMFVGGFAKLRKVNFSLMSVCLSVHPSAWNNSVLVGRILIKFGIWCFFWNFVEKIKIWLKSDNNDEYLTLVLIHVYDGTSPNSW